MFYLIDHMRLGILVSEEIKWKRMVFDVDYCILEGFCYSIKGGGFYLFFNYVVQYLYRQNSHNKIKILRNRKIKIATKMKKCHAYKNYYDVICSILYSLLTIVCSVLTISNSLHCFNTNEQSIK